MIRTNNAYPIINNLWLGNGIIAKSKDFKEKNNIKNIVNISCNIPNYFSDTNYLNFNVEDQIPDNYDIFKIFDLANEFILEGLKKNQGVLVHSKYGINKSATIIAAFLIKNLELDYSTAIKYVLIINPKAFTKNNVFYKALFKYYKLINQS